MKNLKAIVDLSKVRKINATEKKKLGIPTGMQVVEWDGAFSQVVPNTYQKKDPYSGEASIMVWIEPLV